MGDLNYKAFISYSHGDGKLVDWLHKGLEAYRPPKGVGAAAGRPLRPIFRDRAELSAAADLGEAIRTALDHSEFLILVCSEAARRSKWVGEEIRHFLSTHGPQRVICLLVDSPEGGGEVVDCLPQALREALPPGGEPLAADIRPGGDGRRLAFMKIAATLLGTRLDSLIQRDARRRTRWMTAITTGALGVAVVTGALALIAVDARREADAQRAEAEDLVAYMLGDLRKKLEPVGRLDVLDGVGARALAHYAHVRTGDLDDTELAQQAKAQTLLGEVRVKRGDLKGARQAFSQAARTSEALSNREPNDGARLYDHAQNVFWLAYVDWRLARATEAEAGFRRYGELAERLTRLDPSNADWRLEVAYARSNLGTLLFEQGRPKDALAAFIDARDRFTVAYKAAPDVKAHVLDLADTRAWVSDSLLRMGRVREAYTERVAVHELITGLLKKQPDDRPLMAKVLAGQLALARRALDLGRVEEADRLVDEASRGFMELVALDPQNANWLEFAATADMEAFDVAVAAGDLTAARAAHVRASERAAKLRALNPEVYAWTAKLSGRLRAQTIRLADIDGRPDLAKAAATEIERSLAARPGVKGDADREALLLGAAHLAQGRPDEVQRLLGPRQDSLSPEGRDTLARALHRLGRADEAAAIVRSLRAQGYARPDFVAFWRDSALG
ncbi:hypothetical protein DMC25_03840 [Caulobacter sp. D4A]|uniref:toll/interleukin-1 receptor domain-containing protein n=1 Tax=unclassified Caulobacter TaxID=2648921 RepID=UPI000D730C73|nr:MULTISPECIES: toll/interleukin-1 receptor domain-containing protein [unclassified Caulobacter]PXA93179.1 hypothetical protein DMC25_03840 [Caulobacter sp. D4A]PXA95405.1 hypothetical protein DMC18_04045 [Caulobacter sp. D5]